MSLLPFFGPFSVLDCRVNCAVVTTQLLNHIFLSKISVAVGIGTYFEVSVPF